MGTETRTRSLSLARKQAASESTIYRQGSGWIVSTWDEETQLHRTSHELTFVVARQRLSGWRERRAAELSRSVERG